MIPLPNIVVLLLFSYRMHITTALIYGLFDAADERVAKFGYGGSVRRTENAHHAGPQKHSKGQKERDKLCKTTIYPRTLEGALNLEERLQGGSAANVYINGHDLP